ncbi:hypothetical protein [Paenibacillus sp. HB172176]|uniref:RNA dependent RNA polymerase n=1 Tax=Paenibacillus sp. HB172176 TaxID=2493690 RepID=UPI00143A0A39|nr:hypothetical protein [Paenibacillus sp. HB172176]
MRIPAEKLFSNQVKILSVNTSTFYSEYEQRIADKLLQLYLERKQLKKNLDKTDMKSIEHIKWKADLTKINKMINKIKSEEFYPSLHSHQEVRHLNEDIITFAVKDEEGNAADERKIKNKFIISMFESELTRILKIKPNTFTNSIIIVEEIYSEVTKQLIQEGFIYKGLRYCYYSSSAGQLRTKKMVFLRQSLWNKYKGTLMCGLTVPYINSRGGSNVNKFLAYLSLQTSSSVRIKDFDIDRVIVCDDLQLDIMGEVDYIDNQTFKIESNVKMPINMMPTDGAGMCLPAVSKRSFQFRASWIKGLISPFDFKRWVVEMRIKHNNNSIGIVKDIWNKEYDLIEDNIEIIICKSMFKMYAYYDSWDSFKNKFKENNCHAAICKFENENFSDTLKLGYQMIQNLPDLTDDELKKIASITVDKINRLGKDKNVMLETLGVTAANRRKNYYQQALEIYPELLNDAYGKEIIRSTKKSLVKNAKGGKVEVKGKYLFAVPDWWAYCEWLILGKDKAKLNGLLNDEEVYSRLFKPDEKLDILRSPSLYREHGIRINTVNDTKKEWFISNGIYIGHKSLLAKLLMLDYDGDQLFCVSDPKLTAPAERHMKEIVPLHYELAKAKPSQINKNTIYHGVREAFNCDIGDISNKMSVVWNSHSPDLDVLKYLCLINNEVIDFAKTLHRSIIPEEIEKKIKNSTKGKLPYLFVYIKDKKKDSVDSNKTNTVMNRLANLIPNNRIVFENVAGKFDYKMLMNNPDIKINNDVISCYCEYDSKKWMMNIQSNDKNSSSDHLKEYEFIKEAILHIHPNEDDVVDMLVEYLYLNKNSNYKTTLWSSFGDIIIKNIRNNIALNEGLLLICDTCDNKFIKERQRQTKCDNCKIKKIRELDRIKKQKKRKISCPL